VQVGTHTNLFTIHEQLFVCVKATFTDTRTHTHTQCGGAVRKYPVLTSVSHPLHQMEGEKEAELERSSSLTASRSHLRCDRSHRHQIYNAIHTSG